MRWPWVVKKAAPIPQQLPSPPEFHAQLQADIQMLVHLFGNPPDLQVREFTLECPRPVQAALLYLESLTDNQSIVPAVMQPLLLATRLIKGPEVSRQDLLQAINRTFISGPRTQDIPVVDQAVQAILQGSAVLLVEGTVGGIGISLPQMISRAIEEPQVEQVLTGPRSGFVELLQINKTMLRRRLRTEKLRIESYNIGSLTNTEVALVYLETIANPEVVAEARLRLSRIKVDSILDTQQIEELIEDASFSLFPTWGSTERPDVCAAQLLEGNVVILADGSPVALFAPVTFFTFFQSPDDYYSRYQGATWARWLRLLGLLVSTTMPAIAVAIINFHPELVPFSLLVSIAEGRERVPFPLVAEILLMDITFELLREAGLRMPRTIGQALSILGALVLGQAAIQAGLVGPHVILIVAVTAITSFLVGRTKITHATRLLRFFLLFAAGAVGILGLVLALMAVVIHQVSLRSLGVPYMYPMAPLNVRALQDVLIRAPRWSQQFRPAAYNWVQSRSADVKRPTPPSEDNTA